MTPLPLRLAKGHRALSAAWFSEREDLSTHDSQHCQTLYIALSCPKGASIYDVRTEGGGGVSPKEDVVREVA